MKSAKHPSPPSRIAPKDSPSWAATLTRIAFILAVGLVLGRATMQETLWQAFDSPSNPQAAASPGPAASLGLDLLACIPALLVLSRRLTDRTYFLRPVRGAWSLAAMGALGVWTLLSAIWAADKFSALVSAANFAAALVLLWSAFQLVRSWTRLRLVAAAAFGLLLIYAAAGLNYRLIDLPHIQEDWRQNKAQHLQEQGVPEDSARAKQLEANLTGGEMLIFSASPNTYGAAVVLMTLVAAGVLIQRLKDGDARTFAILTLVAIALATSVLIYARSRTAWITFALAVVVLIALLRLGPWLSTRRRAAFLAGVALLLLGAAAFVGHALRYDRLPDKSLTFRWYYWTGAGQILKQHPILGTGFGGFGQDYLAVRRAGAIEEVKDPHNFIVRFFVETGVIGGALVLAWMALLWWELTAGAAPLVGAASAEQTTRSAKAAPTRLAPLLVSIAAAAFIINTIASVDFAQGAGPLFLDMIRRLVGAMLLVGGMVAVAVRSLRQQDADERPAPWLLLAIVVALGMFLLHNLLDFSLFEAGPMFLFALLAGSALGLRHPAKVPAGKNTPAVAAALVAGCIAALTFAGSFWIPTAFAESSARRAEAAWFEAEQATRAAQESEKNHDLPAAGHQRDEAARHYADALQLYRDALSQQSLNSDYAYRAARVADPSLAVDLLSAAIDRNPSPSYFLQRAQARLRLLADLRASARGDENAVTATEPAIRADFRRAIAQDPRSIATHIHFGDALAEMRDRPAAAEQYRLALQLDDGLPADEIRRLPEKERQRLAKALADWRL